ncbi:MAG TPA: hypothetical protein GYA07_08950 [Verrucomicrobia bacterium]|nr:hypothetical protein [Verrucomicrobiota bacterium]HOB33099.1 hypothetical protein [Verrucomicrobiota bacterium]HOP98004.1 hypothetical protein [Verrucomicrobiota bacterium]HPU54910.1 hypothetical protein [Verrucomicrobiota bacterium]
MRHTRTFPSSTTGDSNATFNVVIAYEDFETGKHARQLYDFLAEHLADECRFGVQMWKFDVLSVSKLRQMAARDAADAEIIIVSAHGRADLPPEVKAWADLWLHESKRTIALVALFDAQEYLENPARSSLAGLARCAGVEFFAQPGLWPSDGESKTAEGWDGTEGSFAVLTQRARRDRGLSHWGINE